MSDLIGRIMKEVKVERDAAEQGAGAIFSVIKERVGLRTFQMLRVPFPDAEVWIDRHSGIEGYGAGDYFSKDQELSGPAVDMIERATSSGVPLDADVAVALSIPVIALALGFGLHRVRRRLARG